MVDVTGMNAWGILYRILDDFDLLFWDCWAEDAEHAEEQLLDAEPESVVIFKHESLTFDSLEDFDDLELAAQTYHSYYLTP